MTVKTISLVETDNGWTWEGNEDGCCPHTKCIIAIYRDVPVADPDGWLVAHHLYTKRRGGAIGRLDNCTGNLNDIRVIRNLAKRLDMIVIKGKQP